MILMIDNYDSFTYNLVQLLGELGAELRVERNDALSLRDIRSLAPAGIVISPGPGRPEEAGISMEVVRELGDSIPVLGVCLGHQAIASVYGAVVERAPRLMHGKTSQVAYGEGMSLYAGLSNPFVATRYHSLAVRPDSLPPELEVTATSEDGVIMGIRHRTLPVEGVQFHPESILTPEGRTLLQNFLRRCDAA